MHSNSGLAKTSNFHIRSSFHQEKDVKLQVSREIHQKKTNFKATDFKSNSECTHWKARGNLKKKKKSDPN